MRYKSGYHLHIGETLLGTSLLTVLHTLGIKRTFEVLHPNFDSVSPVETLCFLLIRKEQNQPMDVSLYPKFIHKILGILVWLLPVRICEIKTWDQVFSSGPLIYMHQLFGYSL